MYTLYFTVPVSDGSFAVMSEDYANIGDMDPIPDSAREVSRNRTEAEAQAAADYHQRQSYGKRRQEKHDG